MISGAVPGVGGRALSRHLLKAEGDQVTVVIQPRGVVSPTDLHAQLAELVAGAQHGRIGKKVYHVHCDPPETAPDSQPVLTMWWKAFEKEFGLERQPYVGAQHVKHGRKHEHRVYSLVKPDGRGVDISQDYLRRTYVNLSVAFAMGLEPTPTPFARACAHRFIKEKRPEIAEWMALHGIVEAKKPVAPTTPTERLIETRSGIALADLRAAALEAWEKSTDGLGLERELAARGLKLREGTVGPVVVDKSGTAHALTRLIGSASRLAGERIPARVVKERVAGMTLEKHDGRRDTAGADRERTAGGQIPALGDGQGTHSRARRDRSGGGLGANAGAPRPGSGAAVERSAEGRRLRQRLAASGKRPFARARLKRLLQGVDWKAIHDAKDLADELRAISAQKAGPWVPGQTDQWGIPLR